MGTPNYSLSSRLAALRGGTDQRGFLNTNLLGIPLTRALVDNSRLGSFYVRTGVTIDTTDTTVDIQLGRVPSCYIVVRSSNGAGVYDGSDPSAWTPGAITLRATAETVVSVLVG